MAGVIIWSSIFYLVPLVFIHFSYYKTNKNSILTISEKRFLFSEKNELIEFGLNEIKKVVFNLSYTLYDRRFRWFFWDEYFYAQIYLKNGKNIFITCLLCDELETIIPLKLIRRKKRIFPIIKNISQEKVNEENNIQTKKRIEKLTLNFKGKTKSELTEIINNKDKYQKEAVEIANQVLKTFNN